VRRLLPVLTVGVVLLAGCGPGRVAPDQAAVVDGAVISMDDLTAMVKVGQGGAQPQQGDAVAAAREALQSLIVSRVVLSGAEAEGVSITEADVDTRLDQVRQQVTSQGGNFEQALQQRNLTVPILRNQLRVQLAAEKVSAKLVPGQSDADLLATLGERKQEFLQVHVRHVLVRDQATADKVKAELDAGGDWAAVARRYSTDTETKERGGDLGFQSKGETVPLFEKAAYDLAGKGTCKDKTSGRCASPVSAPVKTEFGWHVLQVTELRLPPVDDQLRGQLDPTLQRRREQAVQDWFGRRLQAASVQVNPRFGRWDAGSGRIVDRQTAPQTTSAPATTAPPQPPQQGPPTTAQ
jgi:foldase protein PrsA